MAKKPFVLMKVEDREYKLKLSASAVVELEQRLGKGLIELMQEMQKVTVQVNFLWAALQRYQHGVDMAAATGIYDDYLASDGNINDYMELIAEVMRESGFLPQKTEEETQTEQPEPIKKATKA